MACLPSPSPFNRSAASWPQLCRLELTKGKSVSILQHHVPVYENVVNRAEDTLPNLLSQDLTCIKSFCKSMSKKPRLAARLSEGSDQEEAILDTLGRDLDAQHAGILNNAHSVCDFPSPKFPPRTGSLSPYGEQEKEDLDIFPLAKEAKVERESKKARRYRGIAESENTRSAPEREHRKHKSDKERRRRPVSPPSSGSTHKSHTRRAGRASGHSSPHFEGRRSQERRGGSRERDPPLHGYRPDRGDEGYRRSGGSRERPRQSKDHLEGRRGSGAPPPDIRVSAPRSYRQRSRSPVRGEARRHEREDDYLGNRGRGGHGHHHGNEQFRRSPFEGYHHHVPGDSSSGEEEERRGEGSRRQRIFAALQSAIRNPSGTSESSGSEQGSEVSQWALVLSPVKSSVSVEREAWQEERRGGAIGIPRVPLQQDGE